jgi:hypothetical protein
MAEQHDVEPEPDDERSALQAWQALFRHFLASGYSWMGATEEVERAAPGLGRAAGAEVARRTWRGKLPQAPYAGGR